MRVHQLAQKDSKSVEPPISIVIVPIRCRCIGQIAQGGSPGEALSVRINGALIEGGDFRFPCFVESEREAAVDFTATITVYARTLLEGVELARLAKVEFVDGWLRGVAHSVVVAVQDELAPSVRTDWRLG